MTILRGHLCGEEDDSYGSLGILPGNGRLNKFQGDMKYNVILVKKEKNQEINLKILIRMYKKLRYCHTHTRGSWLFSGPTCLKKSCKHQVAS